MTRPQMMNVHFAEHDTVFEIQHVNDMVDEEFFATFHTEEELGAMREECKRMVKLIDMGRHISNGKAVFDIRGLEAHTKEHLKRSNELRDTLYESIHSVQSFQGSHGDKLCRLLAQLSRRVSAISTEIALTMAKEDERAVRQQKSRRSTSRRASMVSQRSTKSVSRFDTKDTQKLSQDSPVSVQLGIGGIIRRERSIDSIFGHTSPLDVIVSRE